MTYSKVLTLLVIDSCQWGEWSSDNGGCDKNVCGTQKPVTRTRNATDKHGQICKPAEDERVQCPLNECLGK